MERSGTLAVGVVATDSSPYPPVLRDVCGTTPRTGRGLRIVAALSADRSRMRCRTASS